MKSLFIILSILTICIILYQYYRSQRNVKTKEPFYVDEDIVHLDGKVQVVSENNGNKIRVSKLCIDDECIEGNKLSQAFRYFTETSETDKSPDINWRKHAACVDNVCLFKENVEAFNKKDIGSYSNEPTKHLYSIDGSTMKEITKNRKNFFRDTFPLPFNPMNYKNNTSLNRAALDYQTPYFMIFNKIFKLNTNNSEEEFMKEYLYDVNRFYKGGKIEKTGKNVSTKDYITNDFEKNKGFKMALYGEDYSNVKDIDNTYDALGFESSVAKNSYEDLPVNVKGNVCYAPYSRINLRTSLPTGNQNLIFSRDVMKADKSPLENYRYEDNIDEKMYLSGVPNFHSCFDDYEDTTGVVKDYNETKHFYYQHNHDGSIKNSGDIWHTQANQETWNKDTLSGKYIAAILYSGDNFDGVEIPIYHNSDDGITFYSVYPFGKQNVAPKTFYNNMRSYINLNGGDLQGKNISDFNYPGSKITVDNGGFSKGKSINSGRMYEAIPNFIYYRSTDNSNMNVRMNVLVPGKIKSFKVFKGFRVDFYSNYKFNREWDDGLSFGFYGDINKSWNDLSNDTFFTGGYNFIKNDSLTTKAITVMSYNNPPTPRTQGGGSVSTMPRRNRPTYEKNAREFRFGPPVPLTMSKVSYENRIKTPEKTQSKEEIRIKEEKRDVEQSRRLQDFLKSNK